MSAQSTGMFYLKGNSMKSESARFFRYQLILSIIVFSFTLIPLVAQSAGPALFHEQVTILSKDGTELMSSLALPDSIGTFPTVIMRSPYGYRIYKRMFEEYTSKGYACLVQDVRGRYDSDGSFDPFVKDIEDGDATLEWVRSQPWSNGIVSATGHSYVGFTSLYLTAGMEEAPKAVVAWHPVANPMEGLYRGGAMIHHFDFYWAYLVDGKTFDYSNLVTLDWDKNFRLLPLVDAHHEMGRDKERGY